MISESELQKINDYIKKLEEELQSKNGFIEALEQQTTDLDNKYYNAMKQIDRREFGRKYENSSYDKLKFESNRDVKVKHKSNGIVFELPISHVDINEKIDIAKIKIEDNLEHYIKTMESFYSKSKEVEINQFNLVNLERGKLTVGYKEDKDGKEKPIKEDSWIATFFYRTSNSKATDDIELVKRRITSQEMLFDIVIDYKGSNEFKAWEIAESKEKEYADKYMKNVEFEYRHFYIKSITYNNRQQKWIATYECSAFKKKK